MAVQDANVRLYCLSFNMESREPFADEAPAAVFTSCIPTDYDIYLVGLQESPSELFYNELNSYLDAAGFARSTAQNVVKSAHVKGRGDGSMVTQKKTQNAVWVRKELMDAVQVLQVVPLSFGRKEGSKGAVAVLLRCNDTTLCFINCHFAANKLPKRQEQYRKVVDALGNKAGNPF
eukprot:SAG11_NODE_14666_length_604_cov_0.611881_1_plen_175_part_01